MILSIAPDARIVDISHEVRKFAIRDGALLLWCALPYLPVGSHVAVVDPGVGTERRPVALRVARGDVLIGPDNGLLMAGAERLGGVVEARLLEAEALPPADGQHELPRPGHLRPGGGASGGRRRVRRARARPPIQRRSSRRRSRDPLVEPGCLRSSVVYVDTFGNIKLAGLRPDLEAAIGPVRPGDRVELVLAADGDGRAAVHVVMWRGTFGEAEHGEVLLYEDSYGRICLAQNQGDAATHLGIAEDREVTIRRA